MKADPGKTNPSARLIWGPADILTLFRAACGMLMVFLPVRSPAFAALYLTGGISDMIDGTVARKTGTESDHGSKLDTVCDLVFIGACLYKLLPFLELPGFILIWTACIAVIKGIGMIIGYVRIKRLAIFHSRINKTVGLMLFLLPVIKCVCDSGILPVTVCAFATIAAVHEAVSAIQMQ